MYLHRRCQPADRKAGRKDRQDLRRRQGRVRSEVRRIIQVLNRKIFLTMQKKF